MDIIKREPKVILPILDKNNHIKIKLCSFVCITNYFVDSRAPHKSFIAPFFSRFESLPSFFVFTSCIKHFIIHNVNGMYECVIKNDERTSFVASKAFASVNGISKEKNVSIQQKLKGIENVIKLKALSFTL